MAYVQAWAESEPQGTAPAATLDTIIQNLKVSIRERMAELAPEWADDEAQPKIVKISGGAFASRPADPSFDGHVYFSIDTNEIFFGSGGAWLSIIPTSGIVNSKYALWDETIEPAGDVTGSGQIGRQWHIRVKGVIDATGQIDVPFGFITGGDLVEDIISVLVGSARFDPVQIDGNPIVRLFSINSSPTNSLTFIVSEQGTANTIGTEDEVVIFDIIVSLVGS